MIELYVIRSQEGKYFRSRGYRGYGNSWVDYIQEAKIYAKIGPARAQVTFWAKNYPDYGIPDIVRLDVTGLTIMEETQRVEKVLEKAKTAKEKAEVRRQKQKLVAAQKEFERAKEALERASQ